jgi:hypothetical protein
MSDETKPLPEFIDELDVKLREKIQQRPDMKRYYDFMAEWYVFFGLTKAPNPRDFLAFWSHRTQELGVPVTERYAEVHNMVVGAMQLQDIATYNDDAHRGMDEVAEKTARAILALFEEK